MSVFTIYYIKFNFFQCACSGMSAQIKGSPWCIDILGDIEDGDVCSVSISRFILQYHVIGS
jgi:hypothetical protein